MDIVDVAILDHSPIVLEDLSQESSWLIITSFYFAQVRNSQNNSLGHFSY